jgi:hypothetical protein
MAKSPKAGSAKKDGARAISTNAPLMDVSAFNSAAGKKITGGGNLLVLAVGTAAGPFEVISVEEKVLNPKYDPVNVYTATSTDGVEWQMPSATSFVDKANKASLAVGETFAILRNADYRANGKDCQSYAINILSRTGTPKGKKA